MKVNKVTVILIIILMLAAFLRIYKISEYMTFLGDEGRDMLVVKRMLVDGKWTLLGPTASVGGFFLGPIYYYFMLPFVWLFGLDPVGPAIMVALFGVATVYLIYLFARDIFDTRTGLIVASLYAISPLIIAYSRSSWNPNIVPFFSLGLAYLLWMTSFNSRKRIITFVGVALGIGLQLHYLFLFLFPVALLFILLFAYRRALSYYLWGVIGFLVGYSMFLAFELRHGFPNSKSIFKFIFYGADTGYVSGSFAQTIADVTHRLFGRLLFRTPPPEQGLYDWGGYVWLVIGVTITLLVVYIKRILPIQKKAYPALVLLALWFGIPLILFGFYHKGIYDYYFGIFYAVPFLLIGLMFWSLQRMRFGTMFTIVFFVGLFYWNWQGMPFKTPGNNQLGQTKKIAGEIFKHADNKPFNFALITGGNSDHAYRYFLEIWGNPPVTIENNDHDPERSTVTDQLLVLCEQTTCQPLGSSLWEIAGFGRAEIIEEWAVSFVKIIRLEHYKEAPSAI